MAWLFYAFGTAVCWGLGYALLEKVMHSGVSSVFVMILTALFSLPAYFLLGMHTGGFKASWEILSGDVGLILAFLLMLIVFIVGDYLMLDSVRLKNATHVNIVGIVYPVFTIFFTFLLFKTVHLNWTGALGMLMVMGGLALILYKGQSGE